MTRDKAQAIANPEPGDKWRLGDGVWEVMAISGNPTHSVWMHVEHVEDGRCRADNRTYTGFTRLAENAEYLGAAIERREVGDE